MRCLGLTSERRRCPTLAVDTTEYCSEHQREMAGLELDLAYAHDSAGGIRHLLHRVRRAPARRVVPDGAQFGVAGWIRRSSTPVLAGHLIHHADTLVRWSAAYTLRKRRDPAAVESLWQALTQDPVSMVRQQAAVALGKISTVAVLGPLIEGLAHDADSGVRQACAIALGNLGCGFAAAHIGQVLQREPSAFVRWDCALALGRVGDRSYAALLADLAATDRTTVVRSACGEALAEIQRRDLPERPEKSED